MIGQKNLTISSVSFLAGRFGSSAGMPTAITETMISFYGMESRERMLSASRIPMTRVP